MKILQLVDEPWDSGLTSYALQLSVLLQRSGEEVVVGVRPGRRPEVLAKSLGLETAAAGHPWALRRLLRRQPWDVVNAHTGHTHTMAVLLGGGVPVVRTRGDARPLKVNALSRWVIRRTAGIVAASQHIREQYQREFAVADDKVRTIYPSVVPDETVAPPPALRVGILGRLDPVKGHAIFLEAAARVLKEVPEARFIVAGKEAGLSPQLLRNQAAALGIGASVEFIGFHPSATDFMRSCTVGVIASIGSEAVSRACLEWMAVGRPVVGTLVGSLPEIIEVRETGLIVSPGDSVAMAKALLKMLTEPQIAAKWGRQGHALVRRRFAPHLQVEETRSFYRWAIDAHRAH